MHKINDILAKVEMESIDLPYFQRGYVWSRSQVRALFDSLYRGYPIGSLLTWETSLMRRNRTIELLLDGQQRVTSLYGVINGKPPSFFSGDEKAFSRLYFHAINEVFEFKSSKMKGDPFWFDATKVMQAGATGLEHLITEQLGPGHPSALKCNNNLLRVLGIKEVRLHIESMSDPTDNTNTSLNIVVDIFNRVNSAGTTLSKADLALAWLAVRWPDVRGAMDKRLNRWEERGFNFSREWLLRCVNAVINGEVDFKRLHNTGAQEFKDGLERAVKHIDTLLWYLSSHLGLDHGRVIFSRFAFPVLVFHLDRRQPGPLSGDELNRMLYWYLQAGMNGHFSGSSESKTDEALRVIDGRISGWDKLIAEIGVRWGKREVVEQDFRTWSRGARHYAIMYWLTRVNGARNFCDGTPLEAGRGVQLELHHIFPKAELYKAGFKTPQVNALGNFCFLTEDCNRWLGNALPSERISRQKRDNADRGRMYREGYFQLVEERNLRVLDSQWIPKDRSLWKVGSYLEFLRARRRLLADAANACLKKLYSGHLKTGYREGSAFSAEERAPL